MILVVLLAMWRLPLWLGDAQPDRRDEPEDAASQPVVQAPTLSKRPYPAQVSTESAYAEWLSQSAEKLVHEAGEPGEPVVKLERALAAANFILARQIEPAATRLVLQVPQPGDAALMSALVATAQGLLDESGKTLATLQPSEELRAELLSEWRQSHQTLDAFARALAGVAMPLRATSGPASENGADSAQSQPTDANDDERRIQRRAAGGLAVCLEDDRPAVAASALLWQSVLFGRTGDLDRALTLLPVATRSVSRVAGSAEFFARLQRCRFVAQRGGYAPAVAILLHMEEQCVDWFAGDPRQDEAIHAAGLVRIQTLEDWASSLPPEANAERDWCRSAAAAARREHFDEESSVLRLEESVPTLVGEGAVPRVQDAERKPRDQRHDDNDED